MRYLIQPNNYSQQRQFEKPANIYPVLLAMYATYLRDRGLEVLCPPNIPNIHEWDDVLIDNESQIDIPFLDLPIPDRIFTNAFAPKYQENGNFKYLPGTYMQSALDCWYAKCIFCSWAKRYPKCQTRPVKVMEEEVKECIRLGFREVFDDSGTFPMGMWLALFCEQMIVNGYNKKIRLGCNMRLDYHHPNLEGMRELRRAGFRMILYGLESANQSTLNKLNKGINIESAVEYIKRSAKAGLDPHLAFMVGFPWESKEDTFRTINLVKWLLRKGFAKTAQCSFYTPPKEQEQGSEEFRKYVNKFYEVGFDPRFWFHQIIDIRNMNDMRYLWKGIKAGLSR